MKKAAKLPKPPPKRRAPKRDEPAPKKGKHAFAGMEKALAAFANSLPEAHEDWPWGHRAVKVKGKAYLFMALDGGLLSLSVKLPRSGSFALMQDFAEPTGYGLGKSGWVTATFHPGDKVPDALLKEWIAESYRSIAPKKLSTLV